MQSLALEHCAPPLLFVFFPTTGTAPARQQQRRSLFVKYSRFWAFQQGVDSFFLPVTLRRGLRGLRFWTECPIIEPARQADALPAELTVHILFCRNQLDYNTISDAKKQGLFSKIVKLF